MKKFDLDNEPKRQIFKVPDGYFEELSQNIEAGKYKKTRGKRVLFSITQQVSLVAAVLLVLVLWNSGLFFNANHNQESAEMLSFEMLDKEEIKQFLLQDDMESSELVEYASEHKINFDLSPTEDLDISPELLEQIMDLDELEEYL